MSQRNSGYERIDGDHYETPGWVVDALAVHLRLRHRFVWECACGGGKMVRALERHGARVIASDIEFRGYEPTHIVDFTDPKRRPPITRNHRIDSVITNPPYGKRNALAEKFIASGLYNVVARHWTMAMLLPVDFDSAAGRAQFFGDCPNFSAKITLTKRIKWFDDGKGKSPSNNHAWFLWGPTRDVGRYPPQLLYAP